MNIASQLLNHGEKLSRLTALFKDKKLANTVLFSGSKSVGKFKTSLALSQFIMCETQTGCGICGGCLRVSKEQHESLLILRPENNIIKVDKAREVIQFFSQKLRPDEYKIVIIDGAESLNNQSANALLKTLEEPPKNCFIILITHALHSLLQTVRSRSQVYRFGALTKEQIKKITNAEDWMLDFSGNDLSKIEELCDESNQAVYMAVADAIAFLSSGHFIKAIKTTEPFVKNKSQAIIVIQALQMLFKKTIYQKKQLPCFELDWQKPAISYLSSFTGMQLFHLFDESIKMEYELKSQFDVSLSVESLFNKIIFFHEGAANATMDRHSHPS